jgi:tetratricopeptide (TPR) repeat protein
MYALQGVGVVALRQGDLPRAIPRLERAMGMCQEADLSTWFLEMAAYLGEAYTLDGRLAAAVSLLTPALAQATPGERVRHQRGCRLALGQAHLRAGRLEEAQALAEQALALARAHQERGSEAYALRLLGEIAARRHAPDSEPAASYYRQALALADERGMRPLQAHCHLGLGTLYATTGQREPARAALAAAITRYRAMDMTLWLPQAEAALAQMDMSHRL